MSELNNIGFSSYYHIYNYNNKIYKIVGFKSIFKPINISTDVPCDSFKSYDTKLACSISRSKRIVLEYALCNEWKYFCTFTIDQTKYNRYDLDKFRKDFSQWIRDQRKKYPSLEFKFLFVPEQHKDGAWHLHGLFSDISPILISFASLKDQGCNVPQRLVDGDYFSYSDYNSKFGFCSFGLIKDPISCAFYMTKYITKSLQEDCIAVGHRSVFNSLKLKKPVLDAQIFGTNKDLEDFITFRSEFVNVGMTKKSDNCDWTFSSSFIPTEQLEPLFKINDEDLLLKSDSDMFYQLRLTEI